VTDKAREHLEEVHAQLNEAAAAGDENAGELADQVGSYLSKDAPNQDDDDDLVDRLRLSVRRFEAAHPRLSEAVQGVVDSLTASGI
jgi:hypothetical protein